MSRCGELRLVLLLSLTMFSEGKHIKPIGYSTMWPSIKDMKYIHILNKSENATPLLSIFCEKVLDKSIY